MLIRESKLRQIIKSVIRESISGNRRRLKESDADEYLPNGSHVMGSVPTYVADEQAQAEGMEAWYASNSMPPQVGDEIECPSGGCEYTAEGWQFFRQGAPSEEYFGSERKPKPDWRSSSYRLNRRPPMSASDREIYFGDY
jgi:hypothetical protein